MASLKRKSAMNELIDLIDDAVENSKFSTIFDTESLPARVMQDRYTKSKRCQYLHILHEHTSNWKNFSTEQKNLESLCSKLREYLAEFINKDDEIGLGYTEIIGGNGIQSVRNFAWKLISASILVGTEKIANLICDWKDGIPIQYNLNAKLQNASIGDKLIVEDAIEISNGTEKSLDQEVFLHNIEMYVDYVSPYHEYPTLTIKKTLSPALFQPTKDLEFKIKCVSKNFDEINMESLCDALSLTHNNYIQPLLVWKESEALRPLRDFNLFPDYDVYSEISTKKMSKIVQKSFKEASNLFISRRENNRKSKKNTHNIAISRWIESMRSLTFADKCINLRIALEALFIKGTENTEINFRLAIYCSWFLGKNYEARKEIFNKIREFYGLSSGIIHGEKADEDKKAKYANNNGELFEFALWICQRGIVERLSSQSKPEWNDIVLAPDI